jgi:hypothetical protein
LGPSPPEQSKGVGNYHSQAVSQICGSASLKKGSAISVSISEGNSSVSSRIDETALRSLRDMARVVIVFFNV